jgi:hypothetical protein
MQANRLLDDREVFVGDRVFDAQMSAISHWFMIHRSYYAERLSRLLVVNL